MECKCTLEDRKCHICSFVSENSVKNVRHKNKCEAEFSKTCQDCGKYFYKREVLRRHCYENHEKMIKGTIVCDICGKVFFQQSNFDLHNKTVHEGIKREKIPAICDICGDTLRDKHKLSKHKKYKHQDINLRTCDKCGKICGNRADLYGHYTKDHPKYPNPVKIDNDYVFQCKFCQKILASSAALYTHLKLTHKMKFKMKSGPKVKTTQET